MPLALRLSEGLGVSAREGEDMCGYKFAMNLKAILCDAFMCCAGLSSYADARGVLLGYYYFNSIKPKAKQAEIA